MPRFVPEPYRAWCLLLTLHCAASVWTYAFSERFAALHIHFGCYPLIYAYLVVVEKKIKLVATLVESMQSSATSAHYSSVTATAPQGSESIHNIPISLTLQ